MNIKIFKKLFLILGIIITIFNITFSNGNNTIISKNQKTDKIKSVSENDKSIETKTVSENNNSKFNTTVSKNQKTDKIETISKNKKSVEIKMTSNNNTETKINYYSEAEIRSELKKAGVNSKSIEVFISTNNSKKRNISKEEIEKIKKEFLKAVKLDSKNYLALYALGIIERLYTVDDTHNSYYQAISYFEKVLEINPNFEKAYEYLIDTYGGLSYDTLPETKENKKKADDLLEKSKKFAEQLIKLNSKNPQGYDGLSSYYENKENYDKAIAMKEKVIELYSMDKENRKYYYFEIMGSSSDDYYYTNEHSANIAEFQLFEIYMGKGDDKTTFDYFFKLYKKERKNSDLYSSLKNEFAGKIKKLNEKYKNKDKKLYEENLRKFKALGL